MFIYISFEMNTYYLDDANINSNENEYYCFPYERNYVEIRIKPQ